MTTNPLASLYEQHKDLSEEAQKKAGRPAGDDMDEEHKNFLKLIIGMLDRGEINVSEPETFLKHDVYNALDDTWKAKVDQAMLNVAIQLRQIEAFYRDTKTPNASPELQNMIEHLWQMKRRIEEHHDVFVF